MGRRRGGEVGDEDVWVEDGEEGARAMRWRSGEGCEEW